MRDRDYHLCPACEEEVTQYSLCFYCQRFIDSFAEFIQSV